MHSLTVKKISTDRSGNEEIKCMVETLQGFIQEATLELKPLSQR